MQEDKLKGFKKYGFIVASNTPTQAIGDCVFCGKETKMYVNKSNGLWDCKVCGKKIIIFKSELKQNRGQFCSKSCGGKWYSQHRFGPNHPLYKLNAANRKYRTDSQPYRKWRKAVLDRDNHRCTECEATDNLEIDRGVCSQSNLTVVGFQLTL